ncbi:MAG: sialate O-acetylesterase, partial [Planctomycetota bacterium]
RKTVLGRPVRVYILAGQSNMVGPGSTTYIEEKHPELVAPREDVWCFFHKKKIGPLAPGFGSHGFGPELLFGHLVGDAVDQYVVLIKSGTGGTTQHVHWRSPSAVERAGGKVGPLYKRLLRRAHDTIANLDEVFPHGKGLGFELAGILWLQGENDSCGMDKERNVGLWTYYRDNLFDFIRDLRADLGVPDLPFIIGEINDSGVWDGSPQKPKGGPTVRAAQREAARKLKNVYVFETKDLDPGYHYDSPSHVEIGRRYANSALAIKDQVPKQSPEAVARARKRFMDTYYPRPRTAPDVSSLTEGLIGYWKFDEGGGTDARDSSARGCGGKLKGKGTYVEGLFGKAIRLTGKDRVEFPGFKDPVAASGRIEKLSVAYWIRTPVARGYNRIGKGVGHPWVKGGPTWAKEWDLSAHANERGWDVTNCDHTGLAHFTVYVEGVGPKVARTSGRGGTSTSGDGYEWHHVVAVCGGADGSIRVYVDGKPGDKVEEGLSGRIVPAPEAVLTIGGYLEGELNHQVWDEVAIWDRPLAPGEVKALYNQGYGAEIPVR